MGIDLITTGEAARLLGVDPRTLRKYESEDGQWCHLFGFRLRVYHYGGGLAPQRRYNRWEVDRIAQQIRQAK